MSSPQAIYAAQIAHGAPYPGLSATLGGTPTVDVDVPISAVFMFLFLVGFVSHTTIFHVNRRHGHLFLPSAVLSIFCMMRTTACIIRIVWATHPKSVQLSIASQVFVAAGVVLLFMVNLEFTLRIIRAAHPVAGWHRACSWFYIGLNVLIVISLVAQLTTAVQSFFTLNSNTHRLDRDMQLYGDTLDAVMAFLPILFVLGIIIVTRRSHSEKFGSGRFRTKILVLLASATLVCLGASFRAGTTYLPPRSKSDPPWYDSKACFYLFNFTIEISVVYLHLIAQVHQRFHIPDGCTGPGDYSGRTSRDAEGKEGLDGASSNRTESPISGGFDISV